MEERATSAADLFEGSSIHQRSIGDIALASPGRDSFREQLLAYLDRVIGFEIASVGHTLDGVQCDLYTVGLDDSAARQRMWKYLGELEPQEVEASFRARPVLDTEILSKSRMDQLSMYREYWRPLRIGVLMSAAWQNRFGAFVLLLGRAGTPARFRESEIDLLARCLPQIRLSEALMSGAEESGFECWSRRVGLSCREREVVALVARGLRNSEIADVLQISPCTVRNQLAVVFRKAEVTTRAELVSAMHWRDAEGSAIPRETSPKGTLSSWMKLFRTRGMCP
jgi:DNA-binding CsgD family transcriptional regulator